MANVIAPTMMANVIIVVAMITTMIPMTSMAPMIMVVVVAAPVREREPIGAIIGRIIIR